MEEDPRGEGDPPAFAFFPGAIIVAFIAYWILYWQTDRFAGLSSTDRISLDAAIIGFVTILLVGFQVVLAIRQNDLARVQTDIIRKQDEILNRTEKLTLRISRQIVQAPHPANGIASVVLDMVVVNEGRASCKSAYVVIALPVVPPGSPMYDERTRWTQGIEDAIDGVPVLRWETYLDADIFVQRHVLVRLNLHINQPEQSAYTIFWQLDSEHGTWPAPGEYGRFPFALF